MRLPRPCPIQHNKAYCTKSPEISSWGGSGEYGPSGAGEEIILQVFARFLLRKIMHRCDRISTNHQHMTSLAIHPTRLWVAVISFLLCSVGGKGEARLGRHAAFFFFAGSFFLRPQMNLLVSPSTRQANDRELTATS